jgi:hypothetical protein
MKYERALWFNHTINQTTWSIYVSDPLYDRDLWLNRTLCVGMTIYSSRTILISADAPRKEWSSTLLHELTHAQCRGLSEATVLNVEKRLISALLPHWNPPPLPKEAFKLLRRVRRRNRRRLCRTLAIQE